MRTISRRVAVAAKIALSAGLVYYALSRIDLREAWQHIRGISLYAVIGTTAILFLEVLAASARLQRILAMLGPRCRFIHALDVVFIGAFFSQTLISFLGGDAMRIWRIVRSGVTLDIAAKCIVLDRAAGLAGLLVLVVVTLPFLLQVVTDPAMRLGLLAVLAGGVAAFVMLVSFRHLPQALRRLRLLHWIAELAAMAVSTARSMQGMAFMLGLSLAIHALNVAIFYVLALGLSIDLSYWHCLLLVPPVMFLSMLPVSVAGWGVREGAMIVALGLVGVAPAQSVALSVCFGLAALAISLPGGVLWLLHRGEYASTQGGIRIGG